ncbi:phosphoribosylformylglycinamidine synthase [Clostridium sp. M62/1]|uniref:phosphoribosylformylglycinamidine synthase n=1 Tax=Clostridium sp. M62/1 TaxID=411486 RepID=UPI00019733E0|nr:phosphoribosylformylglycinamidine synthase [Clostridium sp. M62/1]EFE13542.1 phosphoribosylformylglycinamidine synthase [Clostridium sp. M62/1]UEB77605.1 phosphoribosylformylglycinamidine synthase [Clostridium sp. M62/1]
MSVRRIFVEKRPEFAVKAKELRDEIESYLGIKTVTGVRVLIRYDIENVSEAAYREALSTIFSEPPMDDVYEESFETGEGDTVFTVEYLPGQFDQRADSAEQCVKLLSEEEEPIIRSATTYVVSGTLTEEEKAAVKSLCINPVDSRENNNPKPETLVAVFEQPEDVKIFAGFMDMPKEELKSLYESLNLAMTFKDFLHIQNYFKNEEKRDPSVTEIRVLDTYWSDHCRHTTFQTELKDVEFTKGDYNEPIENTYRQYLADREELYAGRSDKFVCLMDLALMAMKKLRKEGKLQDMEVSEEINACSIVVPVVIDGKEEEWLVNFKNETHNHPTEIEPFGGAATCLGGAIRDPLSGRTYVYQAMRVTGAADPTRPMSETMHGKLPQRRIVTDAAHGYSSYGNQIGLATGYVKEIYHPNYAAKRMEIGAVMAAAPRKNVIRETSDPGDVIILMGGRTGRDGIGGATGSSKVHTEESIEVCGAEVQKGNPPTERKLQRLFRRPEVSRLIKKCNDFGAGGVSVAIGELAAGLEIDLDKVPKKYAGLDGTEIAISESQERMAVVVDKKDVEQMMAYVAEENLEAVPVAVVTESPRLVMHWRGKTIVDISRAFLDTNGAHQEASVTVEVPTREGNVFERKEIGDVKEHWLKLLSGLNVCSQKGLVEMFDASIGAGSVFMPYGGKYQLTETQAMVAKLPVLEGKCDTVTMMSYGYDPYLSSWSPYHGAVYAVLDSVAKIAANGGDFKKIRFTFQEYFKRMTEDRTRWGTPFSALLGAYSAQMGFGLPSIGGKDSMSGTFNDEVHGEINVPPTLVSFAVDISDKQHVVTPEFKKAGSKIVVMKIEKDGYDLPVYSQVMDSYEKLYRDMEAGNIISAYAVEAGGIAEAVSKMAFGNKLGVKVEHNVDPRDFFAPGWGNIVCEVPDGKVGNLGITYTVIGEVTDRAAFEYGNVTISMDEALNAWTRTLEDVFATESGVEQKEVRTEIYNTDKVYICKNKVAKPRVFIPVFPGTNCEYDSAKAFERAGAEVITKIFRNRDAADIRDSVEVYKKAIAQSQIVMFPGGFSGGDEPDGSAKFFATTFRNAVLKEEIEKLLNERDGLILGVCNGFQALIKLGLLPEGRITELKSDSPTLAMNTIGRHISKMVNLKVVSNKSPWLREAELGGIYVNPVSHGEGRFVASSEWIEKLYANGQVATQYVDAEGRPTMDEAWNPNGSMMAIEGITSEDGRIYGKMAHSERIGDGVAVNIYGNQDIKIFESGVKYFQ